MRLSFKSEEGFTFTEILCGMAVFCLAVTALWALALRSGDAFRSAATLGAGAAKAELLDRAIRASAGEIAPPFWADARTLSLAEDEACLSWRNGKEKEKTTFRLEGKKLLIESGDKKRVFGGIETASFKALKGTSGGTAGITVMYRTGSRDYECDALFGSMSLSVEGEPSR